MAHTNDEAPRRAELTLSFDLMTFEMNIGGKVPNMNCALAMLRQAADEIQRRINDAAAAQTIVGATGAVMPWMRGPTQ
jgi:hypothetical protein